MKNGYSIVLNGCMTPDVEQYIRQTICKVVLMIIYSCELVLELFAVSLYGHTVRHVGTRIFYLMC